MYEARILFDLCYRGHVVAKKKIKKKKMKRIVTSRIERKSEEKLGQIIKFVRETMRCGGETEVSVFDEFGGSRSLARSSARPLARSRVVPPRVP